MTKVLGIECAGACCSVAVLSAGKILAVDKVRLPSGYPEILIPMAQKVMRASGLSFADMDIMASSAGAGSFTGVRVGLASVRAMALASGKQSCGVSNFAASAFMIPPEERNKYEAVLVVLEPRRQDFYVQLFAPDLTPLSEACARFAEELKLPFANILLAGDAATRFKEVSGADFPIYENSIPDAETIAFWAAEHKENLPPATPLYVSEAHVSLNP